jgi:hypothetical protein
VKTPAFSAATDRGIEMVTTDTYLYGALAEAAIWPGSRDKPNPFFNMEIHQTYEKMFMESLHDAEMSDLERDQQMIIHDDMGEDRFAPIDAKYLQSHL